MPVPVVAIHLELPVEPPFTARLVEACSAGAGPGACVLSEDAGADLAPYLAYVSWLDAGRQHALVEVGPRHDLRGSYEFRRLRFADEDQPADRWEAIGLTVATLVGPDDAPAEPPRAAPPPAKAPVDPVESRPWRGGVSARVGSGFRTGASVGLGLNLAYELSGVPLFPLLFGGWRSATEQGITGQWWEVGFGLGAQQNLGPLRVALAGLIVGQFFGVSATRADTSDSGSSSTSGLAGMLEFAWPASGVVGANLGLHVLRVARTTEISSAGSVVLETPATSFAASLGLEGRF
jgi:hypothetical protein